MAPSAWSSSLLKSLNTVWTCSFEWWHAWLPGPCCSASTCQKKRSEGLTACCHDGILTSRILFWIKRPKSVWLFRSRTSNMLYLPVMKGRIIHFFCLFWPRHLLCSCHSSLLSPGGGNVRIETVKLDFRDKAQAKVGSLENAHHTPGGGHIMVSSSSAV